MLMRPPSYNGGLISICGYSLNLRTKLYNGNANHNNEMGVLAGIRIFGAATLVVRFVRMKIVFESMKIASDYLIT